MPRPDRTPIGLELTRVAKVVSRAFDDDLAAAGGSLPQWLILLALKTRQVASQRELAEAVGIQGATLTAHLDVMEAAGMLTRRRDPANRRVHLVELTVHGERAFDRLRGAAAGFDRRLRADLTDEDLTVLRQLLERLRSSAVKGRPTVQPE